MNYKLSVSSEKSGRCSYQLTKEVSGRKEGWIIVSGTAAGASGTCTELAEKLMLQGPLLTLTWKHISIKLRKQKSKESFRVQSFTTQNFGWNVTWRTQIAWCAHKLSSGDIIVVLVCYDTCRTKKFPCDVFLRMCLVMQFDHSYTVGQSVGVFSFQNSSCHLNFPVFSHSRSGVGPIYFGIQVLWGTLIIQQSLCFLFESLYLICIVLFNLILIGFFYDSSQSVFLAKSVHADLKGTVWEFCFFGYRNSAGILKPCVLLVILFIFHSLFIILMFFAISSFLS